MNFKSIRFRLAFWYTLSLIAGVLIIFTSFYFITKRVLYTETENALTSHSNKIIEVVTSQASNMHDDIAKEAFVREFSDIPGMFVVIINGTGGIVSSSQTVNPSDQVIQSLFEQARTSESHFFVNRTIGSEELRFLVSPIHQDGNLIGVVVMGHPMQVIQAALNGLISLLGVVFVVFLLPSIAGGYLNARGAIAPITAISRKLSQINSGNLDERVNNPKTGDEIEELSETFNSLLDRLQQAFTRERQFISDVAHELKTPLAVQRTTIEVALSKVRSKEELSEVLKESLTDNNRLSSTLKNVLDLAWAEADRAKTKLEPVNLSHIFNELTELTTRLASQKNINVKNTFESDITVMGKKEKLMGAILNIIDNAIAYSPQKSKVTLSLKKSGSMAKIRIQDTGVGIPEKELPHVFERFYRGSSTDRSFGSGLGLAITKATITAFGGDISVKSKPGKGTEFTIHLPLVSS